jgi:hypothetical protein
MNDDDYVSRLWANPNDSSAELLAAREQSDERRQLWLRAQAFEGLLLRVMHAPVAPADLAARLLTLASASDTTNTNTDSIGTNSIRTLNDRAANDSRFWQRLLPLAAGLVLFLGLALRHPPVIQDELSQQIFSHVYAEGRFLEATDSVSLDSVNTRMEQAMGAQLTASPATKALQVRFAKDCWIAKAVAMHMIVRGETGPVSMMMIPKTVVTKERPIADHRFSGFITPIAGGTLVVLGNPQEPMRKYVDLLSSSMQWKY